MNKFILVGIVISISAAVLGLVGCGFQASAAFKQIEELITIEPQNPYSSTPVPFWENSAPIDLPKATHLLTATATRLVEQVAPSTPVATVELGPPLFEETPTYTPTVDFTICSPLESVERQQLAPYISDPYNPPPPGSDDRHHGVDFVYYNINGTKFSIEGVGVKSVLKGRVAAAISDSFPYGTVVIVETPRNWIPAEIVEILKIPPGQSLYLLYAHMQVNPLVEIHQQVEACQLVGKVGHTGNTEAAHLHLETRTGPPWAIFESMGAFKPEVTTEARSNYVLWRTSGIFQHFNPMSLLALDY